MRCVAARADATGFFGAVVIGLSVAGGGEVDDGGADVLALDWDVVRVNIAGCYDGGQGED